MNNVEMINAYYNFRSDIEKLLNKYVGDGLPCTFMVQTLQEALNVVSTEASKEHSIVTDTQTVEPVTEHIKEADTETIEEDV